MIHILDGDANHIGNCWKCLTIMGMTALMHGSLREALEGFLLQSGKLPQSPGWLASRVDLAATQVAKENR